MEPISLPLGFGMALAQNETAMRAFETLPEADKQAVVAQAQAVRSRAEMRHLVDGLAAKQRRSQ